jgi:hypothetical protein
MIGTECIIIESSRFPDIKRWYMYVSCPKVNGEKVKPLIILYKNKTIK